MKKVFLSLLATMALIAGSVNFADAKTNSENFTVRFRENTLVVSSKGMTEARLYNHDGRLLEERNGRFAEFELERGTYLLCAQVDGVTHARKVVLK